MSSTDETRSARSAAPETGERRQVSVLFADMVGYTAIVERLGEEKALVFVRMIYDTLTGAVRSHGGSVRGFAGDSVMAVYGVPEAQEDAAIRACRTAAAIHAAFAEAADDIKARFGERPLMRVGVSSGLAVMARVEGESGEPTAVGDTVNLASRLQNLAPPGGTLICDGTRRLVEWLVDASFEGERPIKGRSKPQKVWLVNFVRRGATRFDASIGRGLSPYVGRDPEMSRLRDALALSKTRRQVVDIMAEPGLGKTRLVFEFLKRLNEGEALVLTGHCSADGRQIPFLPFIEAVRDAFRVLPEDDPGEIAAKIDAGLRTLGLYSRENLGLLLNLLGLDPPEDTLAGLDGVLIGLRTRDLLPALLTARCRASTVILFLEDIHWIDGASEELLARLAGTDRRPNLVIIHTSRPEFLPRWRGAEGVATLALKPLGANQIRHLVQTRLGVEEAPEALIRQVTERSAGNPLFGEEILSFLLEQGALRVEAGAADFDAALGASGLPASMQTLLAARVEKLPREDRALLQAAAAIGRRFDPGLLAFVLDAPDAVGPSLRRLQAQDIVYRDANSSDYVFKHILMRDSVYQSLVTARRSELHLKIAGALEKRSEGRLAEAAETLAYHYGLTDRRDLAFTYLAMAGAKGVGVYSLEEAERYFAAALAVYARDPACASGEQLAQCLADYALCLNISLRVKTLIELASRFRPMLTRLGDSRHHALFLHHYVACLVWNARYLDAMRVQQDLTAMARRLGDPQSLAYALVSELSASSYGAPAALEVFEAERREAEAALANVDDAYLQHFYLAILGWDEVCRGRVVEARKAADRLMEIGRSSNEPRSLGYGMAMRALIAMVTDDFEQAVEMADLALGAARAPFEKEIASAAKYTALALLNRPGAVEEIARYVAACEENGRLLFQGSPETMVSVALATEGRLDEALRGIEAGIARRETEGYRAAADWYRLSLCELYLAILSGEGGVSFGVILRNLRAIVGAMLTGHRKIQTLVETVRANPQFDREGHYWARTELILGLLDKIRKRKDPAVDHLTEARRILDAFGPSPVLTRVEAALEALGAEKV